MQTMTKVETNVQQAVPFFWVSNMEASLRFYVDGLGFEMVNKWIDEGKLGLGVTICFQCKDALAIYREFTARGIDAKRPFVGNGLWVTSAQDPDGYKLEFASPTDVPEETVLSEAEG